MARQGRSILLTLLVGVVWPATPTPAQSIRGTVIDDGTGEPVVAAEVSVLAEDDSLLVRHFTGEDGVFAVAMSEGGTFQVVASRIGYSPARTNPFALVSSQDAILEIRLLPSPVPLAPLETVVEGRKLPGLDRVGFYRREAMGFANVRGPEWIEEHRPIDLGDLFSGMRGISVSRRRGRLSISSTRGSCGSLSIAIDRQVVHVGGRGRAESDWQDIVHVLQVAAVEAFPGPAGLPVWLSGTISPCGAILIWTKGYARWN